MLHVVEKACQVTADRARATVVVESDIVHDFSQAIEELQGVDARNVALGWAAGQGVADPRINGNIDGCYPINAQGLSLDQVRDPKTGQSLPQQHPLMQPARYRADVPITKRLV
jgi:hypothetical protein